MEIAELIVELIRVIIWPLVICGIIFCFKEEFSSILTRIKNLKIFGAEADIDPENIQPQATSPAVEENTNNEKEELEKYKNLYHFENSYVSIFKSQIGFLKDLRNAGASGLSYKEISNYVDKVMELPVWSLDKWPLEKYLQYLEARNFIKKSDTPYHGYKITNLGIEFLEHVERNYPKGPLNTL